MFFIFSKLLLFLTQPFTWLVLLFIVGVVWHKKSFSRKVLILCLTLFLFFSNKVIFLEYARQWEIRGKKISDLAKYDCAIVLTGMATYNNDLDRLSLEENGDRIWQAVDLYHKGRVKKILITGDSGFIFERGLHEALQLGKVIQGWNIPKEDIIIECASQNTYENAKFTAKLLQDSFPEMQGLLLVTSALHMKRALASFSKQNIKCTSFSTNNKTGPKRGYYFEQFLLPDVRTLFYWESLTKEWVGYLMYWFQGYL